MRARVQRRGPHQASLSTVNESVRTGGVIGGLQLTAVTETEPPWAPFPSSAGINRRRHGEGPLPQRPASPELWWPYISPLDPSLSPDSVSLRDSIEYSSPNPPSISPRPAHPRALCRHHPRLCGKSLSVHSPCRSTSSSTRSTTLSSDGCPRCLVRIHTQYPNRPHGHPTVCGKDQSRLIPPSPRRRAPPTTTKRRHTRRS